MEKFLSKISTLTIILGWFSIYIAFFLLAAGINENLIFSFLIPILCSLIGIIFSFKSKHSKLYCFLNILTLFFIYFSMGIVMTLYEAIGM